MEYFYFTPTHGYFCKRLSYPIRFAVACREILADLGMVRGRARVLPASG